MTENHIALELYDYCDGPKASIIGVFATQEKAYSAVNGQIRNTVDHIEGLINYTGKHHFPKSLECIARFRKNDNDSYTSEYQTYMYLTETLDEIYQYDPAPCDLDPTEKPTFQVLKFAIE